MVPNNMDALEWLRKHLEAEGNDLLREMVRSFAKRLMGAEVDVLCNGGYGEVTPERTNSRNGFRSRTLDTRVGTIDLGVARLREGSYYPGWLLEPRRRAERALVAVVAECYVRGVSTRRVEGLVHTLGIESLSKSQVSRMAKELDAEVAAFRARPLDSGPYTYVSLDAVTQKEREHGRIVNVAVVIAVGVNAEGHREVLGFDVITTEDGAAWLAFLRGLAARGLAGTTLVISDAHRHRPCSALRNHKRPPLVTNGRGRSSSQAAGTAGAWKAPPAARDGRPLERSPMTDTTESPSIPPPPKRTATFTREYRVSFKRSKWSQRRYLDSTTSAIVARGQSEEARDLCMTHDGHIVSVVVESRLVGPWMTVDVPVDDELAEEGAEAVAYALRWERARLLQRLALERAAANREPDGGVQPEQGADSET
jgi:hypothetical protein